MNDRLSLNGIDLSGYVANGWGASDTGHSWTVQSGTAKDYETRWPETLSGLQESSITVNGTWSAGGPDLAAMFTELEREVTIWQPDSRWQAIRAALARRWPLRWLKVRWRVYTTQGTPRLDPETGTITVNTTAHVTVAIVTQRGRP